MERRLFWNAGCQPASIKIITDFQPAVALCFQPTHFESEITFGFLRRSFAIANGVSKDAHTTAAKTDGGTQKKMYRWFPTGGRVVLPANAFRVRRNFRVSAMCVRYRERCEQGCSHDRRQDGSGTLNFVPLVSNRRSRCASSQRISSPTKLSGFGDMRPLSRTV
jgi:hypothetical protein